MRGSARWQLVVGALVLVAALALAPVTAVAQEAPPSGERSPTIIPKPNEGTTPEDAGDRGGALQLLLLGLVVVGIGGAVVHLTRQARQARPSDPTAG